MTFELRLKLAILRSKKTEIQTEKWDSSKALSPVTLEGRQME